MQSPGKPFYQGPSAQANALAVGKSALEWALENNRQIRGTFFSEPHPDKDEDLLDMNYPFQPGHLHLLMDHPKARRHLARYRHQFGSFDAPLQQTLDQLPEKAPTLEEYAQLLNISSLLNLNKLEHISLLNEMSNIRINRREEESTPLPLFIEQMDQENKPRIVSYLQYEIEHEYKEAKDVLDVEIAMCKDKIHAKDRGKIIPLECMNAVRDAYANAYLADLTFLQLSYEQGMMKGAKLNELQKEHFNNLQLNYKQLDLLEEKLKQAGTPNLKLYKELETELKEHRRKLQEYGKRFENNRAYSDHVAQQTRYWQDFDNKVEAFLSLNETIHSKLTAMPHLVQAELRMYREGGLDSPITINIDRTGRGR